MSDMNISVVITEGKIRHSRDRLFLLNLRFNCGKMLRGSQDDSVLSHNNKWLNDRGVDLVTHKIVLMAQN